MPNALELFSSRRSRFGRSDPGQDPMFIPIHRNFHQNNNRRHHHQHSSSHHHRLDLDCSDPPRRSPHRLPISPFASSHSGDNPVVPSNRANADAVSSMSLSSNERLPSAVLLARARLLERLRGAPVSGNRHSGRASSGNYERDHIVGDDFRVVDAGDRGGSLAVGSPSAMLTSQTERPPQQETKNKPPGLSQEALESLKLEIFSSRERILSMESNICVPSKEYWDCTICLESFKEGDKLTRLPCGHRFHSTCLNPWVRTCGDCPYCRRGIL